MQNSDPHYGLVRWIEVQCSSDGRWYWTLVTERGERLPNIEPHATSSECVYAAAKAMPFLQVRTLS